MQQLYITKFFLTLFTWIISKFEFCSRLEFILLRFRFLLFSIFWIFINIRSCRWRYACYNSLSWHELLRSFATLRWLLAFARIMTCAGCFDFPSAASLKTRALQELSDRGGTPRKVFSIGVAEFGLCRNAVTAISPGMVTYSVGLNNILNRAT